MATNSKIPVKDSVVDKVTQLIKSNRRYFGSAGASLTHELYNRGESGFGHKVVDIGLRGERNTSLMLQEWIKDKPNAILVDSVHLQARDKKNSEEVSDGKDTDHVLVVGNSVIIVDTKAWRKGYSYKIGKKGTILRGNRNFRGGKVNTLASLYIWKDFFPNADRIFSYVCVQQKDVKVIFNQEWKKSRFKLIARQDLYRSLDWAYKAAGGATVPLNYEMATQVIVSAIKPLDILSQTLNSNRFKL